MKRFLLFVLIVGAAGWMAQNNDLLPFEGGLGSSDSAPYEAFQGFATAMVRGDMDTIGQFAGEESVMEQASDTYLMLRRLVRDVFNAAYRLDAEDPAPGDGPVTLSVSQSITIDPVGVHSSFGTMTCEGKYGVTMKETPAGWRVASFSIDSADTRPEEPRMVMTYSESGAEWPCADSPWTDFSESWKDKVLGWNAGQ